MSFMKQVISDILSQNITSGNLTTTLLTADNMGMHYVVVLITPATTNSLSTVTASVNWTQSSTARSLPVNGTLSLLAIANVLGDVLPIYPDAGTDIVLKTVVSGAGGSYNVNASVRQPH